MMIIRAFALLALLALSACGQKVYNYTGPEVTKLELHKSTRLLKVFHNRRVLKRYRVDLGFSADGHKQFEGDGKTPEGRYRIDRRNPKSLFHLSLGISYPNARDVAFARSQGKDPGGDIFIHGQPNQTVTRSSDWTHGCIALTNEEMRELYAMVPKGTIIDIFP